MPISVNSQIPIIGKLSEELFIVKEVTWKIPTSRIRPNFLDYDMQSPTFQFAGANWILHLYPYGYTGSDSVGCVKLEIERLDSKVARHCVYYKSYFITHRGKEFNPIRVTHNFTAKCAVGWLLHIQKDNFLMDEQIISTEDVLTFKCQMRTPMKSGVEMLLPEEFVRQIPDATSNISRQVSLPSTSESKGETGIVSRQMSLPERENKGETGILSRQMSLPARENKDLSPDIARNEPVVPSISTSNASSPEIIENESVTSSASTSKESSPEVPLEELNFPSPSAKKGRDCATQHSMPLPDSKMIRDFKELFLKKEDCDVVMNVKGQEFLAHRSILRARSPVFASTFRNDMKERATGVIDIEDCDPSSFSDFLSYLYCGNTENITMENVFSLFTSADKYDVQDLRSECIEFLKDNLSVDTFCDTITLAIGHLEKELLEYTTDFFAKHFKEIIMTVKWQSFVVENPIQSNEIMIKSFVSNEK